MRSRKDLVNKLGGDITDTYVTKHIALLTSLVSCEFVLKVKGCCSVIAGINQEA